MVVVFTQRIDITVEAYLKGLGLEKFSQEDCTAAAVMYPSGGHCIGQHDPENADIILVSDGEIDHKTKSFMRSYIDGSDKIAVSYHKGASNNYRKDDDSEKYGHKDVIEDLCEGKDMCEVESHSNSGFVFEELVQVRHAIEESSRDKYNRSIERIEDFICGDIIIEAKVDLLHKLLMPPAEDSGEWDEINEDWSDLMDLVREDPEEEEYEDKYQEAWDQFMDENPQQYNADPFSEKYYGSEDKEGILQNLRDELLS